MKVRIAEQEDMQGWLELASEVEYLFGPMVNDPRFVRALQRNIDRHSAFCVRDHNGAAGSCLLGGLLLSSASTSANASANVTGYAISWLAVSGKARHQGVASALLQHVLSQVERPSEISVITFGEDIRDGLPARALYAKFGFVPLDEPVPNGPEGGSRQKFRLNQG